MKKYTDIFRIGSLASVAVALVMAMSSCEYKDLYEDGMKNIASLRVAFNFDRVDSIPANFRLALYPADETAQENMTRGYTFYDIADPTRETILQVPVGRFHLTTWNRDIEHVITNGYESQQTLHAKTPLYNTTEIHGKPDVIDSIYHGQPIYDYPDYMVHANEHDMEVIRDVDQLITLHTDSMVITINYRIRKIAGMQSLEIVKGALNNVAGKRFMAYDNQTADTVTVMFDCQYNVADSTVYGSLYVFGIEPTEMQNLKHKLTLFFWLKEGKVFLPIDVTDIFATARRNKNNLTIDIDDLDINLKDLIGTRNAFEVTVEEWEDVFIDINM